MPTHETLLTAARRLVAAADAHLLDPCTATADAVTSARLELQEAFIRAGWTPPRYRQEEMQRDRQIVASFPGFIEANENLAGPTREG